MQALRNTRTTESLLRQDLQRLLQLHPHKSVTAVLLEWLMWAVAVTIHILFPNPVVYFFCWLIIGSRLYALYALLHDGVHYLIMPARAQNDMFCRWLLAMPLFLSLDEMRKAHLAHHRFLQTPDDPEQVHLNYSEFQFPQTKYKMAFTFVKDLTGYNFLWYKYTKYYHAYKNGRLAELVLIKRNDAPSFVFYVLVLFAAVYSGLLLPLLLYWVVPYATLYQALNRLRLTTEHFKTETKTEYATRTVKPGFVQQFFLAPHALGYHTEHHLYPGVPFYSLPQLHRLLMKQEYFSKHVLIETSYTQALKQYVQ